MKTIALTQGKFAIVDNADFEFLNQWKWHYKKRSGNAAHTVKGRHTFLMHRIISGPVVGEVVDHINHNTLDNRRGNLRNCTQSENGANRKLQKNNTHGFIGVYLDKSVSGRRGGKRWRVEVRLNGKLHYLGHFLTAEMAAVARDNFVTEHRSQYATLNQGAAQ